MRGFGQPFTWDELNADRTIWTVPAARLKRKVRQEGRENLRVPLSSRAREILTIVEEYKLSDTYVFCGYNRKTLDDAALRKLMHVMEVPVTPSGFRASFKTWATAQNYEWLLVELALDHAIGNDVSARYYRDDALEQRRPMMQAWSDHCGGRSQT